MARRKDTDDTVNMSEEAIKQIKQMVEEVTTDMAKHAASEFKSATDQAKKHLDEKFKQQNDFQNAYNEAQRNGSSKGGSIKETLIKNILDQSKKGGQYSTNKGELGAGIVKEIAKGLERTFAIYVTQPINSAIKNMQSAYESNFTEIAGRMGTDRKATHIEMRNAVRELNDSGFKNAINANKELIPELKNVAAKGWKGNEAIAIALTNSVDKKIMPWLETQSAQWSNLQFNLSESSMQQLKSQQLMLQESRSGNRLLQSGVINSLTNDLAPILTNIDFNTGGAENLSAEGQAIMESLVESGRYSEQEAYAYVQSLLKDYRDPTAGFERGDPTSIFRSIAVMNGGDLSDIMKAGSDLSRIASSGNILTSAIMAKNFGVDTLTGGYRPEDVKRAAAAQSANIDFDKYKVGTAAYTKAVADAAQKVTATQSYDNGLQNSTTEALFGVNGLRHGVDMLENISTTAGNILKLLVSWGVGKLAVNAAGKLLNNAGGEAGSSLLNGLLSKAGGKAAGKGLASAIGKGASTAASMAGPALAVAGIATNGVLAAKEFSQVGKSTNIDKENTAHKTSGTIAAAGAGAGLAAGGIGLAAGFSIPVVGWIAAAVTGIALVAKSAYDARNTIGGSAKAIAAEYEAQKVSVQKAALDNESALLGISSQLQGLTDSNQDAQKLQEARNDLINTGLLSEEDVNRAREANVAGLQKLTDSYLKANDKWSTDVQLGLDKYELADKQAASDMQLNARSLLNEWLDSGKLKEGSGELDVANTFLYSMYKDLNNRNASGEEFDKSTKKIYEDLAAAFSDGKLSEKEANSIIDEGFWNDTFNNANFSADAMANAYKLVEAKASSDKSSGAVKTAASTFVTETGGTQNIHGSSRSAEALSLASQAANATNEASAKQYLETAKSKGYRSAEFSEIGDAARAAGTAYGWDEKTIQSYRVGTPYVTKDQLALIHEGEAVLTAQENKERLRTVMTNAMSYNTKLDEYTSTDAIKEQTEVIKQIGKDILAAIQQRAASAITGSSLQPSDGVAQFNPITGNTRNLYANV